MQTPSELAAKSVQPARPASLATQQSDGLAVLEQDTVPQRAERPAGMAQKPQEKERAADEATERVQANCIP